MLLPLQSKKSVDIRYINFSLSKEVIVFLLMEVGFHVSTCLNPVEPTGLFYLDSLFHLF